MLSKPLLMLSGRQQVVDADLARQRLEREQIAHGVPVFGAAETMRQRQLAEMRTRGLGAIELRFEERRHARRRWPRPAAARPAAASTASAACGPPSPTVRAGADVAPRQPDR